jgi:hypothetical protein
MHGAVLGSAWGGQSSSGKSLKEIQEEEARAAERRAAATAQQQQQHQSKLPPGGWASTGDVHSDACRSRAGSGASATSPTGDGCCRGAVDSAACDPEYHIHASIEQ